MNHPSDMSSGVMYVLHFMMLLQVIGMPSTSLMEEMGESEKNRLASQAEELGQKGLDGKQQELEQAVEENEVYPVVSYISHILTY